jgi:hypothetical protein
MEHAKQRRVIDIHRGLLLVRYVAADDEARPPAIKVSPEPASDKNVSLVLHPDRRDAVLWQPGTCLIVRAVAESRLLVEVVPAQIGGSVAATIRMERLTQGEKPVDHLQTKDLDRSPLDLGELRLLGHIASVGDVIANANEWLAGPSAPSRIEGIAIEWPEKPEDVDISYSVETARPQTISGRTMDLGSFAGTRGKAMPVVGVMLELSGEGARNFQFSVEAIFLGSPALRMRGRRIELSGPTGREPLVGLKVAVEDAGSTVRPHPLTSEPRSGRASSGVRVFRSRPKTSQSVAV